MARETWTAVDAYVSELLVPRDEALAGALESSEEAGLPSIQVSPPQGKLLHLLAKTVGAKSVLEFGTLGGYSTIWMARALSDDGRLITLEADPRYAAVARQNIARAGLGGLVDLRVGPALDLLPDLEVEEAGPFDLIFIDADKVHSPDYFTWSLEHTRRGGLIVTDNVVRDGRLADASSEDPTIRAQRRLHEVIAAEPRVEATTIQTVGGKGYDGFNIARVA
jgi:predicted O-methyltransferase YrrM